MRFNSNAPDNSPLYGVDVTKAPTVSIVLPADALDSGSRVRRLQNPHGPEYTLHHEAAQAVWQGIDGIAVPSEDEALLIDEGGAVIGIASHALVIWETTPLEAARFALSLACQSQLSLAED